MALFVECGNAGHGGHGGVNMPVEVGSELFWVEEILTGQTGKKTAPSDDCVATCSPDVNGYVLISNGSTVPQAKGGRRLLANTQRSFALRKGDKLSWFEG
jgi:hypothetical protein